MVIGNDCVGSCKYNYHTIMTTMAPEQREISLILLRLQGIGSINVIVTVCVKLSEDLSVIRSDRLIGFVCPKYFLFDRKVSTIIVKVGVVLTFTFITFSSYFVINGIQFHLLF